MMLMKLQEEEEESALLVKSYLVSLKVMPFQLPRVIIGGWLTGGIELNRLAVEDYDQLERRADEITEENINTTCTVDGGYWVSQVSPICISFGYAFLICCKLIQNLIIR